MNHDTTETLNRTPSARRIARQISDHRMIASHIRNGRDVSERLRDDPVESLHALTSQLKQRIRKQESDDEDVSATRDVLSDAIGVVDEAIRRALAIELFDVQWHAGIVMSLGGIVEMQTGEGKTLAGVLPTYVNALRGKGVHVATPNAYLARRDYEQLKRVFDFCGITTAVVEDDFDETDANAAYGCDVTYGSAHTFGFDYLKDQLVMQQSASQPMGERFLNNLRGTRIQQIRQRGLASAIVDEADDVLLDDAVSPLILSGSPSGEAADAAVHRMALAFIDELSESVHFVISSGDRIELTDDGFKTVYEHTDASTHPRLLRPWHEYVCAALRAAYRYRRDVHYVVRDDEIQLIDGSTGRVFADRTWSGGLHQAVQAREGLAITNESVALGRITKQRFFRSYRYLTGMTGTADQCQRELEQVYGTPVAKIALRNPSKREVFPPRFAINQDDKYEAVVNEAFCIAETGRPVLIGTLSVSESQAIADLLREYGRPFDLLNGVQDADEAAVVSAAGRGGAITVATNLAGRGTDIKLDALARASGGLHVIVTQMHSLARVDRQLIGRAARCGDPGSCRFFVAADAPLLLQHAPWISRHLLRRDLNGDLGRRDDTNNTGDHRLITQIETVQRRIQREATSRRLQMLQNDSREQQLLSRSAIRPNACWAM
ncbi:DEAD/DEAH box helicase [Rhodopirellula sp. SWK7]|uniref:preprotein translocase subunit SecA n=1 Tax=Rhodopirellula sp. SWK7 TaxID=595460 RepID=UPI0002BD9FC2|nr:DEAD/DEAH box helicase [Rhodopirellula sp. SWK7]EMI42039.1 preprotein translocase subunit SecA [Rhodopirellula sp. SWK7]